MPCWACFGVIWNQSKELKRNSNSQILNFLSFDKFHIKNVKNTKKNKRETKYMATFNTMYPSVHKHKYIFN